MKKIISILFISLMVLSLTACKKQEEKEVEVPIVGGYTDSNEDMNQEYLDIFNKAVEGLTGCKYEPVKLLGTQVVAGTNYKFLVNVTPVVPNGETKQQVFIIYKDLQGNISLTDTQDYKE